MVTTLFNLFLILLLIFPSAYSIHFKIPRFDATAANIVYEGDAVPAVGVIELIDKVNYVCRVGRATYSERVPLFDSRAKKVADFSTHFSFIVDTQGAANYGSGFAFYIAPFGFQIPPNSAGGFLGLFNTTTSDFAGNHVVLVEFDSFVNPEWDPSYQHVGINNNSVASVVNTPWNVSLHNGDTTDVWISYNSSTRNLSVEWSYQNTPAYAEETTSLAYEIDLTEVLPEWITIGFSAGTSQYMERNKIVSWELNSTLDRIYPGSSGATHTRKMMMIIVSTLLAVSAVSLIVGMITAKSFRLCHRPQKKHNKEEEAEESVTTSHDNLAPIIEEVSEGEAAAQDRFTFRKLATATKNFSDENKLGEGASGTVYKGEFSDINVTVAVKKISGRSDKGRKEYMTEVNLISSLRHPNLVQLKGWCHDVPKTTYLLAYEYMPNGSPDSHLFGKRPPLM